MLRLLVVLALVVAAVWYFTKDAGQREKLAEQQREVLEDAKTAAQAAEEASAAVAAQADAIRDSIREQVPEDEQ
ncbi:MAG: hypothetical protein ACLGHG_07460 [Gammaproteobacteria bacterium]